MNADNGRPSPTARTRELIVQYFVSRALWAAAVLDVAGCLAGGALSAEQIAAKVGAHGPSLYRLLRALASAGVFEEDADGRFRNTPMSEPLRPDVPGSLRDLTLLIGHETSWRSWEAILHSVRTGECAFEHVYGERSFDYMAQRPDVAEMFDRAMASASSTTNAAVVEAYDFSSLGLVVDVAGGVGAALGAILNANPRLRGIVFDQPHVAVRATAYVSEQGLADRCRVESGSFFEAVPGGADAYFMKHILHDWGDEDCLRILRTCRRAMQSSACLLVCERIVPPGNEPAAAKLIDLHMLATNHGGRERTAEEYRGLLGRSGFELARVVPTATAWSVIEGRPV